MSETSISVNQVDCLFCQIIAQEIPATVIAESEQAIAFRDINPQAPTHVLVVPRAHYANVGALAEASPQLLSDLVALASQVAATEGITDYRLVFNTGASAGQSVFHVHGHVLGGRPLTWPPG